MDPFLGTGTSAIAAKCLGRNYIGFELDKKYADISKSKLEIMLPNSKISDTWVSVYRNELVTVRNEDWSELEQYYIIPELRKNLDHTGIKIRDKSLLPSEVPSVVNGETVRKGNNGLKSLPVRGRQSKR